MAISFPGQNLIKHCVRKLMHLYYLSMQKWDGCLCREDSDGDGRTNGEELGDPNCVWTEGDLPEIVDGITHPGKGCSAETKVTQDALSRANCRK